jgi:hypothetical protein
VFLAYVITGNSIDLPSNSALRAPPADATGKPHDSVKGHTGGSDIYIVYENLKCYPGYLVKY